MSPGQSTFQELRPEAFAAMRTAVETAYAADADDLLPLCRARIATLVTGVPPVGDAKIQAVGDYATSELFTDTERLALEFVEQYVLDVANTPDALIAALRERLGVQRLYAFVMGLYAIDQSERLKISTTVHPGVTP